MSDANQMLRTRLTTGYGIARPLVSAGMGFIAAPPLAAAVSDAGALGLLAAGSAPPHVLAQLIRATRRLTSRPFGVNFIVETIAFGPLTVPEHIDVCIQENVPIAGFFWNLPPAAWIHRLKSAGVKVWFQTGSVEQAREAVAQGMDAIIAQGSEAGGHIQGNTGLLSLLPAIVDAVDVPVIAAGGIADGRTAAAALALGAEGVCVGTRFVASVEANAHEEYKRRIVAAQAADISRTCLFGPEWPDAPMRVIRNRVVAEWAGRDATTPPQPDPPEFIGATRIGPVDYRMPKFSAILPTPETTGDFEEMCLAAGESTDLVHEIRPAAEIVAALMDEAERIIKQRLAGLTL